MNIIFTFTVFHFSCDLQFKSELSEENSIKRAKSNSYNKYFDNCSKIKHVGLYNVGTHYKKFGEKIKNKT
jgi:glutathione peroxidase-family protein